MVNGKTVDVKSSKLRVESRGRPHYGFRLRSSKGEELPDFICLFCILDNDKPNQQGNYRILLLPKEVLPDGTNIHLSTPDSRAISAMYWDFEVQPAALAAMLGVV